jgi:hypothetical protein
MFQEFKTTVTKEVLEVVIEVAWEEEEVLVMIHPWIQTQLEEELKLTLTTKIQMFQEFKTTVTKEVLEVVIEVAWEEEEVLVMIHPWIQTQLEKELKLTLTTKIQMFQEFKTMEIKEALEEEWVETSEVEVIDSFMMNYFFELFLFKY